jgi:hypothetical protein
MVIAAVSIMTFLLADFTFETKLNKIKIYNQIEKDQARLNAEAGVNFALAKLRLYQTGRNLVEKTESLKGVVNPSDVESIVTMPFAVPIPAGIATNLIQKTALEEFTSNSLVQGNIIVTVTPVAGFLNPNNMRVTKVKGDDDRDPDYGSFDDNDKKKLPPQAYIEKKLIDTLQSAFDSKRESDDEFDALYGNLEPKMLIKELKYFVNDPDNFNDSEKSEIEILYSKEEITPKHAPMRSIDEMYLLAGWDDDIVNLIKDRLTTHEVSIIPVNKITSDQLKIIFPQITEEQIEEFFKYRDGDPETKEPPKEFKTEVDFKNVIVGRLGVLNDQEYTERIKEFENAGLKIGVAGKLYKVVSTGSYKRSTYKLTAYVDLPILPTPPKKKKDEDKDKDKDKNNPDDPDDPDNPDNNPDDNDPDNPDDKDKEKQPPLQLMAPRVIEIRAN